MDNFFIRHYRSTDGEQITKWAREEGFNPGLGDITIYDNTDKQGIWVGCLGDNPIGSIAGIKYNNSYGFLGLFIVSERFRGRGFGLKLWKQALDYLSGVNCIGLEAAPNRLKDYSSWGFKMSSKTTRWELDATPNSLSKKLYNDTLYDLNIVDGNNISKNTVQIYDSQREKTFRPHFLSNWLAHPLGQVSAVIDQNGMCHGFGRIRPCLLQDGNGWRIGPLIADTPPIAEILLRDLLNRHFGKIFLDCPGLNPYAPFLLENLGFSQSSHTFRMYKGEKQLVQMNQIYGLACLELG